MGRGSREKGRFGVTVRREAGDSESVRVYSVWVWLCEYGGVSERTYIAGGIAQG